MSRLYSPPHPHRGFTLIELMVTIAIVAIISGLAAPSFLRLLASNRIASHTTEFSSGVKLARAEALRRGIPVTIRALSTSSIGDFGQAGWEVFPDADGDGAMANTDTPIRRNPVTDGTVTVQRVDRSEADGAVSYAETTLDEAARSVVVFTSRGIISTNVDAFFRVCDAADPTVDGRILRVSMVGNVSMVERQTSCRPAEG